MDLPLKKEVVSASQEIENEVVDPIAANYRKI